MVRRERQAGKSIQGGCLTTITCPAIHRRRRSHRKARCPDLTVCGANRISFDADPILNYISSPCSVMTLIIAVRCYRNSRWAVTVPNATSPGASTQHQQPARPDNWLQDLRCKTRDLHQIPQKRRDDDPTVSAINADQHCTGDPVEATIGRTHELEAIDGRSSCQGRRRRKTMAIRDQCYGSSVADVIGSSDIVLLGVVVNVSTVPFGPLKLWFTEMQLPSS